MTTSQINFIANDGRELLLKNVNYDIKLNGLIAKTAIKQHYLNPYDTNIEAIYTFPLASNAILLNIELKINDKVLKGVIKEKSEAEADYEEAIDEGNRAIMVEKNSDGIFTINIANLLPQDEIVITLEYIELLEWRQNQVKFSLPTTIAPKYGNPAKLNLDETTEPAVSFLAENFFSLNMRVFGVLANSDISAPSHQIKVSKKENQTLITIEKEYMDKDIVFTFKTDKKRDKRSFALIGKDFNGYAAIASFYPTFQIYTPKPKSVTFVIDCSGSMDGISIQKAKIALSKALGLLRKNDTFNIIKFGTHNEALFEKEVLAIEKNIKIAQKMVDSLRADMGGTEMESALNSAYAKHNEFNENNAYLFLITDGQIYDRNSVIESAKKSKMSHFIVGVGYASDDAFLSKIAKETNGAYENIDPNEKMDDYILNLFKKIDTPKALNINVNWNIKPKFEYFPNVVFDGETLYVYALFEQKPTGNVTLSYKLENGNEYKCSVGLKEKAEESVPSVISKIVIAKKIEEISALFKTEIDWYYANKESSQLKEIINLSTKYQLFSKLTNYILVDNIEDFQKPVNLPKMYRVKSMMSEKSINMSMSCCCFENESESSYEAPRFLRKHTYSYDMLDFIEKFDYLILLDIWYQKFHRLPRKKSELLAAGFDSETVETFKTENFREEIKLFAIKLYKDCDNLEFSEEFTIYMEKLLLKNRLVQF